MRSRQSAAKSMTGWLAVGLGLTLNVSALTLTFENVDDRNAIDYHFQIDLNGQVKNIDDNLDSPLPKGGKFSLSETLSKAYVKDTFEFSYATDPKRRKGKLLPEAFSNLGGLLISVIFLLALKSRSPASDILKSGN